MTSPNLSATRPTLLDLIEQPGAQRVPIVNPLPTPAAGADWSFRVPAGVVWELQSIRAQLSASAVAGSRQVALTANDGIREVLRVGPGAQTTASNSSIYGWNRLGPAYTNPGFLGTITVGLPDVPILGAWTIAVTTLSLDVGDQWTSIVVYAIERRPALDADLAGPPLQPAPTS